MLSDALNVSLANVGLVSHAAAGTAGRARDIVGHVTQMFARQLDDAFDRRDGSKLMVSAALFIPIGVIFCPEAEARKIVKRTASVMFAGCLRNSSRVISRVRSASGKKLAFARIKARKSSIS